MPDKQLPDDEEYSEEFSRRPYDDEEYDDDVPFDLPRAGRELLDDDEEYDDEDVPFDLPRVGEEQDEETDKNGGPDDPAALTMPVFREPGVPDPRATLAGSGGLDPNPDFIVDESDEHTARHARPDEQPTMTHQRLDSPQTVRHQPVHLEAQGTIPAPRTDRPGQPLYPPPPPTGAQGRVYGPPGQQGPMPPPPRARQGQQLRPRRRRRRVGCLWVLAGLLLTFCGGLTLFSVGASLIFGPQLEAQWEAQLVRVDDYRSFQSTFIYDRQGSMLWESFTEGRRTTVPYSRFPKALIDATISVEDDTFWGNIGINVPATVVAFLQYLGAEPGAQTAGGSTITQQLVRNVLFDPQKRAERSVERKVEEIILAILLTQRRSKEDILEMYLNEIYYGNLAYGAQTAAQTFFGKNVEDLTLGEAALLAGLPQAPASLDPLNPDPAVQAAVYDRWRLVLDLMVGDGFITPTQRAGALREGLSFVSPNVSLQAPHFTVYAQGELERLMRELGYPPELITRGGLRVYTTLDQGINNMAQQVAAVQVGQLGANNVSNAAVIVLKPLTGEIVAMVGSIDYNNDAIDGRVNVTTAFRQPGSTMKPFTYSAAIERGMTPGSVIWDTPTEIGIPGQPLYRPRNYDNTFHGPVRMRTALANSYNIPAVQTLRLVGVDYLLELMHRFGTRSLSGDASRYGLSLTLGGGEITLIELTAAYSVFANQGVYVRPTSILCIVDNDNNILYQYENGCPEGRMTASTIDRTALGQQVLDPRIAFLMSDIMADNVARTPAMGASSPLRTDGIGTSVKTGTTDDIKDNWTVGYTRNVAVGVWVGNNDGAPMVNSSGLTGAAPIWNSVITTIHGNPSMRAALMVGGQLLPDQSPPPQGMTLRSICDVRRLTDPSPGCPATVNEWFLDGPAALPDGNGGLYYPQAQSQQPVQVPGSGTYAIEVSPGVYRTLAFPIPAEVAAAIQFQVAPGDKLPPPPRYCRVPVEVAAAAVGAQELLFIGGPVTSQGDAVEAERWAQGRGLAYLPTIDCWPEIFTATVQSYGPTVVTAVITSPVPGEVVTGNMPILGTVQFSQEQAVFYKIEILGGPFTGWTTLGSTHSGSVVNGQLEYLYAEGLPAGSYQIRLALVAPSGDYLQQPYVVPFTKQ